MPSSVVAKMIYNPETETLRIIFVSGMVYDYLHVPQDVYAQMKASGSKGTFLNKNIKTNFSYRKVKG